VDPRFSSGALGRAIGGRMVQKNTDFMNNMKTNHLAIPNI
jgi:hypothetical protein